MYLRKIESRFARLLLIGVLIMTGSVRIASAQGSDNEWRFALTPYLWLPTIDGELKYDVPRGQSASPNVEVGPSEWLKALDYALLINGEARKGRLSAFGDLIMLKFSADDSTVKSIDGAARGLASVGASLDTGTDVGLKGLVLSAGLGYSLTTDEKVRLDAFGGLRYFRVETSLDWRISAAVTVPSGGGALSASGTISQDVDLLDAIVGLRGEVKLGDGAWSLPYYADIGTGSSKLTWQAAGGVAYAFGNWDAMLLYRHLYYDQDDDKLLQNFSFSGPAIAARFRF